jgi:hypothetical protein
MRRRPHIQILLSSAVVLCCAAFAYLAKTSGLSDFAVACGTTVVGAVVLGVLWRRLPDDPGG